MNFAKKYLADLEKQKKSMVKAAKKEIDKRKFLEKRLEEGKNKTSENPEELCVTPVEDSKE